MSGGLGGIVRRLTAPLHRLFSASHSDVDASVTPADGDVPTYVAATGKWTPQAPSGGGGLDIDSLTPDGSPDGNADYVATWDASASDHKKVLLDNLPGASRIRESIVHLTNTELFALETTPVELVPAPGAGLALVPVQIIFKTNGATGYDNNGGGLLHCTYAPDTTGAEAFASITDNFLTASAVSLGWVNPQDETFISVAASKVNQALIILESNSLTNDGGSTETLTITTLYRVVTM
jgi:hypothetical protein